MELLLDDSLVGEIEVEAAGMARAAGEILRDRFGKSLEVEYKDKKMRDPVTSVDKESQSYLSEAISRRFAHHGILGEESPGEKEDDPLPPNSCGSWTHWTVPRISFTDCLYTGYPLVYCTGVLP